MDITVELWIVWHWLPTSVENPVPCKPPFVAVKGSSIKTSGPDGDLDVTHQESLGIKGGSCQGNPVKGIKQGTVYILYQVKSCAGGMENNNELEAK